MLRTAIAEGTTVTERQTFTVEEVRAVLGLGRNAVYEAVRRGEIPAIRIGGRWLVPRASLERLLRGQSTVRPVKEDTGDA